MLGRDHERGRGDFEAVILKNLFNYEVIWQSSLCFLMILKIRVSKVDMRQQVEQSCQLYFKKRDSTKEIFRACTKEEDPFGVAWNLILLTFGGSDRIGAIL
jgi:hypothetical protein